MKPKDFFDNYWEQEGNEALTKLADKKYEVKTDSEDGKCCCIVAFDIIAHYLKLEKEFRYYKIIKWITGVIEAGILIYLIQKTKGL